jgi:mono/diheme cytochrome c family protein
MNQIGKKMRVSLAITVILVSIIGLSSCEKYTFSPPQVNPNDTVYYQTDIQSIFNSDCISCHGGATSPNLTAAKSYNALTKGGYVTPDDETYKCKSCSKVY